MSEATVQQHLQSLCRDLFKHIENVENSFHGEFPAKNKNWIDLVDRASDLGVFEKSQTARDTVPATCNLADEIEALHQECDAMVDSLAPMTGERIAYLVIADRLAKILKANK